MESWRGYLSENKSSTNLGAIGKTSGDANASLVLIDLDALGEYLKSSKDVSDRSLVFLQMATPLVK